MTDAEKILSPTSPAVIASCNRLGWPSLRPVQAEVVAPILEGRDVVAVLPTSAGKSGIFQVPALSRDGLVVVISPLVALMADQVDRLRRHGVRAFSLNSHCSASDKREAMEAVQEGKAELLYISPERLQGIDASFFGASTLQMFAIDEAHCISEWGHDFRPAYRKVGKNLGRLGDVQCVALTATATSEVVDEIATVLGIDFSRGAARIVRTPDRPNITYGVSGHQVSVVRLISRMEEIGLLPCLVYGSTRRSVEDAAHQLSRAGYRSDFYHAGMTRADRTRVQNAFLSGELQVIAATCAFGMGIDHPGIRSVIHLEMPTSLEAYMQESGRAGRDGSQSIAICRATQDTLEIARNMVALEWPSPATVRRFWGLLQPLFEPRAGKWEGRNVFQRTNGEIASLVNFDPKEVGSCLRILSDCGAIRRAAYQDRPVSVTLLSTASTLKGTRQKQVVATLRQHSDAGGVVRGSVAFFRDVIGLDLAYARRLNERHALQLDWVDRCQLVERCREGDPGLDDDQIHRVRRRSLRRIQSAMTYLASSGCRRSYLLSYFGDTSGGSALGRCCDRCVAP